MGSVLRLLPALDQSRHLVGHEGEEVTGRLEAVDGVGVAGHRRDALVEDARWTPVSVVALVALVLSVAGQVAFRRAT